MKKVIQKLMCLLAVNFSIFSSYGQSGENWYYNIDTENVATHGFDLVSYHTKEKPEKGKSNLSSVYEDVSYLFSSKKNKNSFDKNPEKYLPAYGG